MSFFDKLKSVFRGPASGGGSHSLHYYVRCRRCHEILRGRVNLYNDLSIEYNEAGETAYVYRKVLIGSKRCFEPIEVTMTFDSHRNVTSKDVTGGEFVSEEEYEAAAEAEV